MDILTALAAIISLAFAAHWLAWRLRLPSILLFLAFGFLVGPIFRLIDIDAIMGDLLFPVVSLSIAIILFEGGLTLRVADIREVGSVVRRMLSLGVVVTFTLTTVLAVVLLGFSLEVALTTGAILVVTGPTVIIPLLQQIRPVGKADTVLRWEGIAIDPIGVVLTVLVFEAVSPEHPDTGLGTVIVGLITTAIVGLVIGYLAARLLIVVLRRRQMPDRLEIPFTLFLVLASFALSDMLQSESGLLTVTVMGVVLANQDLPILRRWTLGGGHPVNLERIIEFKETLQILIVSSLFIILSSRLRFEDFALLGLGAVAFIAGLILIVRPVSIWLCTLGSPLTWRERAFIAWMAPRGIVAAATASVFGLQLSELGVQGGDQFAPLIFAVIVATVVVYGLTSGPLARRLGLSKPDAQGVLIIGAHDWARAIAQAINRAGFEVTLVDANYAHVKAARMDGLRVVYGSALSDRSDDLLDLGGIGRMLALTPNDEVNTLAVLKYGRLFGRSHVYQLPPDRAEGERLEMSEELSGQRLFAEAATYTELSAQFAHGSIKATQVTEAFPPDQYTDRYAGRSLPLLAVDKAGRLVISSADRPVKPQIGATLIALIQPEPTPTTP